MNHILHKEIGEIINRNKNKFQDYEIIYDTACLISSSNTKQNIPLFCSRFKSNMTEYCNVDILFIKNNKVKIIIEIDESNLKPTQICGKFLTSALSSYYIHPTNNNEVINMYDFVSFIQIVDISNLKKDLSSKTIQWENIEQSIQQIIPIKGSKIGSYKLIYGKTSKSKILEKKIINQILKSI